MAPAELRVAHLGLIEYRRALALQERLRAERQAEAIPDTLLLLEHPMVYTRGNRAGPNELPMGDAWYAAQGIDVVDVNRGGKVTYHGPGQLVGYTIMRTDRVAEFVRRMERALVVALQAEGLNPNTREAEGPAYMGVWIEERKIASVGIHVSRGVTMHGFAVNVRGDLTPFGWVVPCGLPEVQMTSVQRELERVVSDVQAARFAKRVAAALAAEHGLTVVLKEADGVLAVEAA